MSKETSQGDAKRISAIREAARITSQKRPVPDGLVDALIVRGVSTDDAVRMLDHFALKGWVVVGGSQFGEVAEVKEMVS